MFFSIPFDLFSIDDLTLFFSLLLIAISWVYAAFKEKLIKPAIWSIILFMLGFGIMRLLKIASDGVPDLFYLLIFLLEIITAYIGFWLIKKK